jgi:hypothetical protein
MSDSTIPPAIECFVGTPRWDGSKWVCPSDLTTSGGDQPPFQKPNPQPLRVQPVSPTINIFASGGLLAWVRAHPYLILGGAALLYWLLFMNGGNSIRSRFRR